MQAGEGERPAPYFCDFVQAQTPGRGLGWRHHTTTACDVHTYEVIASLFFLLLPTPTAVVANSRARIEGMMFTKRPSA